MEKFEGFEPKPQSWDFPNVINGWVHKLTGAEFKVLWYILRHTYGWQKDTDYISLNQFQRGIKKKSGEWLDRGTGLSRQSIINALKKLEELNFIVITRIKNEQGQFTRNRYSVVIKGGSIEIRQGVVKKTVYGKVDPQSLYSIQSLTNNNCGGVAADTIKDKLKNEFSLKEWIDWMKASPRRYITLIGDFAEETKPDLQSYEQGEEYIDRHVRAARKLSKFNDDQIAKAWKKITAKEWLEKPTMETIIKYLT